MSRYNQTDTIAAIGTALSDSGIGIVRISGDNAFEIVNKIFLNKNYRLSFDKYKSHTIHYGYICDYNFVVNNDELFCKETFNEEDTKIIESNIIDEVMISKMVSPNSYTKEDTVEINCHGGVLMVKKVLENTLRAGCRLAEPGEYTKRAFLNGRIDLSKAEAVIDIIHSKNEFALKNSVKQLKGSLSNKIIELRKSILFEIAFIESALDDPEHISLDGYNEKLTEKVNSYIEELKKLIATADNGRILKDGVNTVILGRPNAGKSSLLNLILEEDRAIVTDIAGTTRDILEESINFGGINLNIIDTAGIRSTEDVVEKIGVEKALSYAKDADLILYVIDSSKELNEDDEKIFDLIKEKKSIILLNKEDLNQVISKEDILNRMKNTDISNYSIVKSTTSDKNGIEVFKSELSKMFDEGSFDFNDQIVVTNIRHKNHLQDTLDSILKVKESLELFMPEDFLSIDLMSAYASLGYIIGEEIEDDLVQEIFSKFCMGK